MSTYSVHLIFILISLLTGVIIAHRSYLSPAKYYNADGSTLWENVMPFLKKKSFWPVPTYYKVGRNYMSQKINNELVFQSSWIEFVLWNGQGIKSTKITGLNTGELLYPTKTDVRNTNSLASSVHTQPRLMKFTSNSNRYSIVAIKPEETEKGLRIVITDTLGNITQDIVDISQYNF